MQIPIIKEVAIIGDILRSVIPHSTTTPPTTTDLYTWYNYINQALISCQNHAINPPTIAHII